MKNRFLIIALLVAVSIVACQNKPGGTENNKSENSEAQSSTNNANNQEFAQADSQHSMNGKFIMYVMASDGTWFLFDSDAGEEYKFFDNGQCADVRTYFSELAPNSSEHKYGNTRFHVEYKTAEHDFFDKDAGEYRMKPVDVITKLEIIK